MEQQLKADLLRAFEECGSRDPHDVRNWALAHPESVLYRHIEWDTQKAALEYQLAQIRGLIAKVKVLAPDPTDDKPTNVRELISTPTGTRQREYVERDIVMNQRATLLAVRAENWRYCITRIANLGAADDADMLAQMREHLVGIEEELDGLKAA